MKHSIKPSSPDNANNQQIATMCRQVLSAIGLGIVLASAGLTGTAQAASKDCASCSASEASGELLFGTGVVVAGAASMLVASGAIVVGSVEAVSDGVVVVFKSAGQATGVSVKFVGEAAKGASLAAGTVVEVTAIATGSMLTAAGKAIAFIPNEVGASLIHHSKVSNGK